MICPVCKISMVAVEHNKIELDYCHKCRGVWFDSGELELLLESMNTEKMNELVSSIRNSPAVHPHEKKRKCPICGQKMRKAATGEEPKVLIDVCERGDGLWFDGGEVGQVIRQMSKKLPGKPGSEQKILAFLGDTFKASETTETHTD